MLGDIGKHIKPHRQIISLDTYSSAAHYIPLPAPKASPDSAAI